MMDDDESKPDMRKAALMGAFVAFSVFAGIASYAGIFILTGDDVDLEPRTEVDAQWYPDGRLLLTFVKVNGWVAWSDLNVTDQFGELVPWSGLPQDERVRDGDAVIVSVPRGTVALRIVYGGGMIGYTEVPPSPGGGAS